MNQPALQSTPSAGVPITAYKKGAADTRVKAAFVIYITQQGDVLFTRRSSEAKHPGEWDFPGGGVDEGESDEESARRESMEEIGVDPGPLGEPVDAQADEDGVDAVTFLHRTKRFVPQLNPNEHDKYLWAPLTNPPEPLHSGVIRTLHAQSSLGNLPAHDASYMPRREKGTETQPRMGKPHMEPLPRPGPHTSTNVKNYDEKQSHEEAHYRPGSADKRCGLCTMFRKGEPPHCTAVADPINPHGDCDLFERDAMATDAAGVEVDREHDGPWLAAISKDGKRVYVNKNLPHYVDIKGKSVNVDEWLASHEVAELAGMAGKGGHLQRIYQEAHEKHGIPAERAWVDAQGIDWDALQAWAGGMAAHVSKGPFHNAPDDAHVHELPNGELAATDSALQIAFDRASVRDVDIDGRMHVGVSNISKANVCPYRGKEIPNYEDLGLDADEIYQLYRHPEELAKSAPTFNRVQLLKRHVPVSADDHRPYDVIGTTGSDASYEHPYLRISLSIWEQDAIDDVLSGDKRELSCGYHYVADMTPGVTPDGERYDGVMRSIIGNHVAIVEDGRAGSDVVVGDSAENLFHANIASGHDSILGKGEDMPALPTKFANLALQLTARGLRPILAKDSKIDLMPIFAGVTSKNFNAKKIAAAVGKEVKGKLAKDANLSHVTELLDSLEHPSSDESVSGSQHRAMAAAAHGEGTLGIPQGVGKEFSEADRGKSFSDALPNFLRGKGLDEEAIKEACDMAFGSAKDAFPPNAEDPEAGEKKASEDPPKNGDEFPPKKEDDEDEEAEDNLPAHEGTVAPMTGDSKKGFINQKAFDAALDAATKNIRKEVRQNERDIRIALDEVKPYVGELRGVEYETPKQVYAAALKTLGMDAAEVDALNKPAMRIVLKHMPKAGARPPEQRNSALGMDASDKSYDEMFPGVRERIKSVA